MATVATYTFTSDDGYNAAKNALSQQLGGSSYDTSHDSTYYYIYITSDCPDTGRAGQICSGNGGKVYG